MTPLAIVQVLLQLSPSVFQLVDRVRADIAAGRGEVPLTQADWDELNRLASQSAEDIYARLGITPPPPSGE